jgi:hypothetical protein
LVSRFVMGALPMFVLVAVGSAGPAEAAPPTCDPVSAAQITAVLTPDGHATFTVGNGSPLCDPAAIGAALYLKDADGFVVPQTLAASATGTLTSGSMTLSVAVPKTGTTPHCFFQLDAFTGPPLPAITETAQYGPRLLAYLHGVVPKCEAQVEAESTTTTSTTTSFTQDTTVVEAVAVTQPAATTAKTRPTVLARTGPPARVEPLLAAAGWLLILGGSCLALSTRR